MSTIYSIKIGGQAGQGVKSAGLMLAKTATRSGYNVHTYTEYPSLIRGGHNVIQIRFSDEPVTAPSTQIDLLVALNKETIDKHMNEIRYDGFLLADVKDLSDVSKVPAEVAIIKLPLVDLVQTANNKEALINTAANGAVCALLGGDLNILKKLIREEFSDKSDSVVESNLKTVENGYNYVLQHYKEKVVENLAPKPHPKTQIYLDGNEAMAAGAINAGVQFAAIYPMTPISNIMHNLALHQQEFGYVYKQPEDEIAAINMAIGASYAGARAMTATSGGGFCLMTEGYGLAGITETPLVIIEGMRGGPATGMPTWTEQGDLRFVLHAHQSEFPKIILAPGDQYEAFLMVQQAFNLADKYQTPVVVIVDKNICEDGQSYAKFNTQYKVDRGKYTLDRLDNYARYKIEPDGISLRTVPGTGNYFVANSDEHEETGELTEESGARNAQMRKRMEKLVTCAAQDMAKPVLHGPEKAELTIVSWGSTKGSILEAMKKHKNVNFLQLTWLNPFPAEEVKKILENAKDILNIEENYSAQMAGLIRELTGVEIKRHLLKYDGRPIFPEDVDYEIAKILGVTLWN